MNHRTPGRTGLITLVAALVSLLSVELAFAQAAAPPSSPPAATSPDQPATPAAPAAAPEQPPVPPEVDRVLRRVEKAGEEVQKLQATFEYHYVKRLIRAEEWRSGTLVYQQPSNFLINFVDGEKQTYRFNGRVFVEDRPNEMQRNVYRLRKDEEPPVDNISIDRTPFPLPFGQKRDDVLKNFTVESRGAEVLDNWKRPDKAVKPDERRYERLVLTPKPDSPLAKEYVRLDFWVDMETGLPKQIRTQD